MPESESRRSALRGCRHDRRGREHHRLPIVTDEPRFLFAAHDIEYRLTFEHPPMSTPALPPQQKRTDLEIIVPALTHACRPLLRDRIKCRVDASLRNC